MAWSTREIAELAGTSLRAVRHYHEVGLLDEPERRSNGYKQYGVAHLIRLLRIKRLVDLGFSLPQIADMGDADDHPEDALRTLDAELAATIERLQRARVELSLILRKSATTDLPAEFTPATIPSMSDADRSFVVVMSRVLGPQGQQDYADMLKNHSTVPMSAEFDALSAHADEQTRVDLAKRLTPYIRELLAEYPAMSTLHADAPRGERFASQTVLKALKELYNPAQRDVLRRTLLAVRSDPDRT